MLSSPEESKVRSQSHWILSGPTANSMSLKSPNMGTKKNLKRGSLRPLQTAALFQGMLFRLNGGLGREFRGRGLRHDVRPLGYRVVLLLSPVVVAVGGDQHHCLNKRGDEANLGEWKNKRERRPYFNRLWVKRTLSRLPGQPKTCSDGTDNNVAKSYL